MKYIMRETRYFFLSMETLQSLLLLFFDFDRLPAGNPSEARVPLRTLHTKPDTKPMSDSAIGTTSNSSFNRSSGGNGKVLGIGLGKQVDRAPGC